MQWVAAVRDHHGTRRLHRANGGEFFALAPFGDRAGGEHVDRRLAALVQHGGHKAGGVDGGHGVWLQNDAGDATIDRCCRASGDGFLVLLPRLAAMHMRVEQRRNEDAPLAVDDLRAFDTRDLRRDTDDAPPPTSTSARRSWELSSDAMCPWR